MECALEEVHSLHTKGGELAPSKAGVGSGVDQCCIALINGLGQPCHFCRRIVTLGVVENESTGVIFSVGAAARQPASSSLVLVSTSLSLAPSLSFS